MGVLHVDSCHASVAHCHGLTEQAFTNAVAEIESPDAVTMLRATRISGKRAPTPAENKLHATRKRKDDADASRLAASSEPAKAFRALHKLTTPESSSKPLPKQRGVAEPRRRALL